MCLTNLTLLRQWTFLNCKLVLQWNNFLKNKTRAKHTKIQNSVTLVLDWHFPIKIFARAVNLFWGENWERRAGRISALVMLLWSSKSNPLWVISILLATLKQNQQITIDNKTSFKVSRFIDLLLDEILYFNCRSHWVLHKDPLCKKLKIYIDRVPYFYQ